MKPVSATRAAQFRRQWEKGIVLWHREATAQRRLADCAANKWKHQHVENARNAEREITDLRKKIAELDSCVREHELAGMVVA